MPLLPAGKVKDDVLEEGAFEGYFSGQKAWREEVVEDVRQSMIV